MKEITIQVSPEVADAYQTASDAERRKIQVFIEVLLQKKTDADVALLRGLMNDLSDRVKARGLTPEILDAILNER